MKSSFSFIFFVFSVSCIAFASGGAQDFRQYFLVQTWPPVYCQVHRPEPCRIKPSKFVLHGLWPVNSSGRSSTNTNNQTINVPAMRPRTAITLAKAVNLEAAFRDAGINPDGDGLSEGNYTLAIVARNGTTPLYKCLNKSLLMEVTLCVDTQAINFVPCIAQRSSLSNCVGDIIWAL
ncbi:hypothetical protein WN943_006253 [Citrus x changshan-huyou]